MTSISIVIPAKNEAAALALLLPALKEAYPTYELIVVNDGSTDQTSEVCTENGVVEVRHAYSKGNGAAVKSGVRKASGDIIVFMDGDGQHKPEDVARLIERMGEGFDMVVGARDPESQASMGRLAANTLYNKLASWVVEREILDLTSGMRAVRASKFREFLYLLPNGFSYPTTSTMAFFRAGYSVDYIPIRADKRIGKSHISITRDGLRFLIIIFKIGTLYSPLKIFFPISVLIGAIGLAYYLYSYMAMGRFTNMSALMFTTSLIVFMMGLISEQITTLIYKNEK